MNKSNIYRIMYLNEFKHRETLNVYLKNAEVVDIYLRVWYKHMGMDTWKDIPIDNIISISIRNIKPYQIGLIPLHNEY